ncbi:MAG TPA: hypothetical protein PKC76_10530 [Saprospiraceae bacterium]|nr:hypothetical protein [Saprospiraceae bacterium]HMP24559.1 hypothetical protein [Saprospiraceae bacterium]
MKKKKGTTILLTAVILLIILGFYSSQYKGIRVSNAKDDYNERIKSFIHSEQFRLDSLNSIKSETIDTIKTKSLDEK